MHTEDITETDATINPAQIKKLRDSHGWTQVQLAGAVGTTPRSIGQWERGETDCTGAAAKLMRILTSTDKRPDVRVRAKLWSAPQPARETIFKELLSKAVPELSADQVVIEPAGLLGGLHVEVDGDDSQQVRDEWLPLLRRIDRDVRDHLSGLGQNIDAIGSAWRAGRMLEDGDTVGKDEHRCWECGRDLTDDEMEVWRMAVDQAMTSAIPKYCQEHWTSLERKVVGDE